MASSHCIEHDPKDVSARHRAYDAVGSLAVVPQNVIGRAIIAATSAKVLATEHEAKHLSAHDFRHAALTHMAAVGSDLTAIGHVAGHKNATTTALYVHNSEAAARRAVARRAGILDTKVDTVAGQAAEKRPVARLKSSESLGGPSWTRTRSQWIKKSHLRFAFPCETQGYGKIARDTWCHRTSGNDT